MYWFQRRVGKQWIEELTVRRNQVLFRTEKLLDGFAGIVSPLLLRARESKYHPRIYR
jgi:hypothetical protein